jgi:hypothetical protein
MTTSFKYEIECNPSCPPEVKVELHVSRYRRALLERVFKRGARLSGGFKSEVFEVGMAEVEKRLAAYKIEVEAGNYPEPDLSGIGFNYFEPGYTYWNATSELTEGQTKNHMPGDGTYGYVHIKTLATADLDCLRMEWMNVRRIKEGDTSFRHGCNHIVQVMVSTEQLRWMVDNWPEVFADSPPLTDEELSKRPQEEQDSHETMLKDLDTDPINAWIKEMRGW